MDAERPYRQPIVTDPDTVIAPAPPTPYNRVAACVRGGDREAAQRIADELAASAYSGMSLPEVLDLGLLLHEYVGMAAATPAYQYVIDRDDPELSPKAAFDLGLCLGWEREDFAFDARDIAGAQASYQRAIDSGHPEMAPRAAINLGLLLDLCGDTEGARTALVQAADSGHAFLAPRAALALGLIQLAVGDPASACDAYRRAIGYDNSDLTPTAWLYLGVALVELGDVSAAQAAMRQPIESRQDYLAEFAAHWLELLTSHERDLESARDIFRQARYHGAALYKDRLPPMRFLGVVR